MRDPLATTLQQHAGALRELARALVGPDHADDLVQATAIAALRHRIAPRRPLPFLRHVLRQLARRHHRTEARRRRREHAAAGQHAHTAPPAEHALEQKESIARLHAALLAVPQPHLGALLLRWFEGLPPAAIAERLDVPLPTIKSRLQRGLELLREELDRRAPRAEWRSGLALAFGLPGPLPAPVAAAPAALPLLSLAIAMKVLLLSCAGIALAVVWSLRPSSPPLPGAPAAATAEPAAAAASPAGSLPEATGERTAALTPAAMPAAATARLRGRILAGGERPLPGARIEVRDDLDDVRTSVLAAASSGDDGGFDFELLPGRRRVRITAAGHVGLAPAQTLDFAAGEHRDLGDVLLQPGIVVRGRVVDRDGTPVANVTVWPDQDEPARPGFTPFYGFAFTDEHGRFELAPRPVLDMTFEVPEEQLLEPVLLRPEPGQREATVELRVESAARQPTLRGAVVDEAGRPIPRAMVVVVEPSERGNRWFDAITRDDGTFAVRRLLASAPRPAEVQVEAEGLDAAIVTGVEWGRGDLQITLRRPVALAVRVVDTHGRPVPEYRLRVGRRDVGFGASPHGEAWMPGSLVATADGRCTVPGLRRGSYVVHIKASGDAFAPSDIEHIELQDDTHHTVVLPARAGRTLRLVLRGGAPVAGARIELCEAIDRPVQLDSQVADDDDWSRLGTAGTALLRQQGVTDARGELLLHGPADTPLAVRVLGPGCLPFVAALPRLPGDGPLVLEATQGGGLRAQARPAALLDELATLSPAGSSSSPPRLWLMRRDGAKSERMPMANREPATFASAGELLLTGIPPGTWTPVLQCGMHRTELAPVTIADGSTTELAIDLAPMQPFELRGRIVVDGAPARPGQVQLQRLLPPNESRAGRWQIVSTDGIDEHGVFVARGVPGRYRVLLSVQAANDTDPHWLLAEPAGLELAPGDRRDETFRLDTGSLRLRLVDAQQRPVAGVASLTLRRTPVDSVASLPPTDEHGRARIARMETGTFQLVVFPRRLGTTAAAVATLTKAGPGDPDAVPRALLDLGMVVVTPGGSPEQTLVLPDAWFQ